MNFDTIIVLGATATGKTRLAVQLANKLNGEIISADSRQVFKGMDIGSGKDLQEYFLQDKQIQHHLIDIRNAGEKYNVDAFKNDVSIAFSEILRRGKIPVICGGTGMYIHSLLVNQPFTAVPANECLRKNLANFSRNDLLDKLTALDDARLSNTDLSSSKRMIRAIEIGYFLKDQELPTVDEININPIVFGLKREVSKTRLAIKERLQKRFNSGLIEEVQCLLAHNISHEQLEFYGLEYKFISQFLKGEFSLEQLHEKLYTAICQFAKRQNTFFRKMEKDGVEIHWIDADLTITELVEIALKKIYHPKIINQSID